MNMILTDGTELAPTIVTGGLRRVHGADRDTLTFMFPGSQSLESLDCLFIPENCEHMTIIEDNGDAHIHTGYTIRAELSKHSVEITPETNDTEAVYEDRVIVSMSQRTYAENQIAELATALNVLLEKAAE